MSRSTKDSLNLQCRLSQEDRLRYSSELSEAISAKARAEDTLKSFQTQAKAEIASHEAKINLLAEKLNVGYEYRSTDCEIRYDWDGGTRYYIRIDTGEIAKTEEIPQSMRQEDAFL